MPQGACREGVGGRPEGHEVGQKCHLHGLEHELQCVLPPLGADSAHRRGVRKAVEVPAKAAEGPQSRPPARRPFTGGEPRRPAYHAELDGCHPHLGKDVRSSRPNAGLRAGGNAGVVADDGGSFRGA